MEHGFAPGPVYAFAILEICWGASDCLHGNVLKEKEVNAESKYSCRK